MESELAYIWFHVAIATIGGALAGAIVMGIVLAGRLRRQQQALSAARALSEQQQQRQEGLRRVEAVADERERIYADLHDDIGAKLLSLVYQADSPLQADLARSILQDLRDVVSRSRGEPCTLRELLEQLQSEARRRTESAGITLDWQQPEDLRDCALDAAQNLHLARIVREGISNVIQHSGARLLRVRLRRMDSELGIELADDGSGLDKAAQQGRGLDNMRRRAAQVEGDIDWSPSTAGGTRVVLRMPLGEPAD